MQLNEIIKTLHAEAMIPKKGQSGKDLGEDQAALARDPILRQLKVAYDDVANEPFPEHLLDLLEKLEKAETRK